MAFQEKEPGKLPSGAYREMLYGSEGALALSLSPLAPFQSPEQIKKVLEQLHNSETSPEKTTSPRIETVLKNRWARLQKMIAYIDVEASLHSLTREFLGDLTNDFTYHIHAVFDATPERDSYIPDYKLVNSDFRAARDVLDVVMDAYEDAGRTTDVEVIIQNKKDAYTALHKAIVSFEAGLANWKTFQLQPEQGKEKSKLETLGLNGYLQDAYRSLQDQLKTIRLIREALQFRDINLPPDNDQFNGYERRLRTEVLATLLQIPEQPMLGDQASIDIINRSKIFRYITSRPTIISNLRSAKLALNLALDRFEWTKEPLRVRRSHLTGQITLCVNSLDTVLEKLEQKT